MSSLKAQLRADRVAAMKAKDEVAKKALALALTAVQKAEVAGKEARELSDAEILAVLGREVAQRKDSAEAFRAGGREDLVAKELAEAELLARYLPEPLTEAELDALVAAEVERVAAETGADVSMRQMGLVIKGVNARAEGRAPGALVAQKVKAVLAAQS
jgi:uncharacterized protein YqeY